MNKPKQIIGKQIIEFGVPIWLDTGELYRAGEKESDCFSVGRSGYYVIAREEGTFVVIQQKENE